MASSTDPPSRDSDVGAPADSDSASVDGAGQAGSAPAGDAAQFEGGDVAMQPTAAEADLDPSSPSDDSMDMSPSSSGGAAATDMEDGTAGLDDPSDDDPPSSPEPVGSEPEASNPDDAASDCTSLPICEGFETTNAGQLPQGWELIGYGERNVGVSTDRAASGQASLHIDVPPQAAVVGMIRHPAGELSSSHWGRVLVWIDGPMVPQFVHYDLFAATGPWMGHQNEVRWAVTGTGVDGQAFIYNVQPSGDGAGSEFGTEGDRSAHPSVDTWMCLEWHFDAAQQQARFFLMGEEVEYLHIDDERAEIPEFEYLHVGFQKFQQTDAFSVFVDDVAFASEQVGCPQG
jgi:hypothetical protein